MPTNTKDTATPKRPRARRPAAEAPAGTASDTSSADGPQRFAMSDDHKQKLAEGRRHGSAVRHYLEALDTHKPKRGRKRTPESIQKRLALIEAEIGTAGPVERLQMIQERIDLGRELESMQQVVDLSALEAEFVDVARDYSARKGISYAAWRELGISAEILKRAQITR